MKRVLFLLLAVIFCCHGAAQEPLADEEMSLVLKREIVSKKLDKLGYGKWIKIQREYLDQASRLENAKLKSAVHKNSYLRVIREYQDLKKIQKLQVDQVAQEDLEAAQKLLRLGESIHGYQLRLDDFFAAPRIGRDLSAELGRDRFLSRSWMRTHGNLYQAMLLSGAGEVNLNLLQGDYAARLPLGRWWR